MSWLVWRMGLATLPRCELENVNRSSLLGGIGFTMSIFIDNLAFATPSFIAAGKIAVLAASTLAAVLGLVWLQFALRKSSNRMLTHGEWQMLKIILRKVFSIH